ncbi:hypothetical protein MMC14_007870 [Varicellaria rhodocarpa]|nr:hypothetical protein [Varicellaria rhodocarpa]
MTYPDSKQRYSTIAVAVTVPLTTIFVWLRVYTKLRITRNVGCDDYTSVLAWAAFLGEAALFVVASNCGLGAHQSDLDSLHLKRYLEVGLAGEIVYGVAIFITKLSILLQFLRIFQFNRRCAVHYTIHSLIWFNLLYHSAYVFSCIFQCTPISKELGSMVHGRCINLGALFVATGVINVVSDFSILALPILYTSRLKMEPRQKLLIIAVFTVGLFACIASVARMAYSVKTVGQSDMTWKFDPVVLWTMAEISIGIICGCLPVLPQFIRHYISRPSALLPSLRNPGQAKYTTRPGTASSSKSMTTWHDPESPSSQLKNKYIKLGERRLSQRPISITESLRNISAQALVPNGEGGVPTARWDLEEAQRFKVYSRDLPAVHHNDKERARKFGYLLDIADESIISLALKIRNQASSTQYEPSSEHRLVSHLHGSYNLIFAVEFADGVKYVVRIPSTGWGDRYTESARKSFESQIMTMRLIHNETTIPVPKVYDFDASQANELRTPWMVISFIPGSTIAGSWFDQDGPTPLEERRRRALETIAEAMSQLRKFRFWDIGSLELTDQSKQYNEINALKVDQDGPFHSSSSYLSSELLSRESLDSAQYMDLAADELTRWMILCMPHSTSSPYEEPETFVLDLPDFDSQNIMIDEQGNLTGLIDWDNAQTNPRCLGYCRYPAFITYNWDAFMYRCTCCEHRDSPEELARYRQIY